MAFLKIFKDFYFSNKYISVLTRIVLYYLIVLGVLYTFQNRVLYTPTPSTYIPSGWVEVKNKNYQTIGIEQNTKTNLNNVIVLFHGNAGNSVDRTDYKGVFRSEHIVVLEYPGYGLRSGEAINKKNLTQAALELTQTIKNKYPNSHITLVGESLGTGIASEVAQKENIKNLVLITPYTSIAEVAQEKFWYFPVKYLVKDNYTTIDNLKNYQGRVLILSSEKDEVIPSHFALKLYDSLKTPKTLILVKNATHNSWVLDWSAKDMVVMQNFIK